MAEVDRLLEPPKGQDVDTPSGAALEGEEREAQVAEGGAAGVGGRLQPARHVRRPIPQDGQRQSRRAGKQDQGT